LAGIFTGSIRTKAHEKFWRKGSVGVSRDCPNFSSTPIISGTRKATNFKFGTYIQRAHPSKSPLKIWKKRERWRIQGLPKFFEYPLLSQERIKNFNFGRYSYGVHPNKSPLKILEKREPGHIQGLPKFFGYPYYLRNG